MHLLVLPSGLDMDYASCVLRRLSPHIPDRVVIVDNVIDAVRVLSRGGVSDLYVVGHGVDCAVFADGMLPLFMVKTDESKTVYGNVRVKCDLDIDLHLVRGVGVHLLACNTGAELGETLMQWGARYFIGYSNDFVTAVSTFRLPKPCTPNSPNWDVWTPTILDFEIHLQTVYGGGYADEYLRNVVGNYPNVPIRPKLLNAIKQNMDGLVIMK